jgi:hypothetical protein
MGAFSGGLIGFASGDDPPGSGFFTFTAGEKAAFGAIGFGVLGGIIGGIAGAVSTHERWVQIPLDRMRFSIAPQRDGQFALKMVVSF